MKQESALTIKHTKTPDCKLCDGLCCIALLIKKGKEPFKFAGDICAHLNCSNGTCNIHEERRGSGLGVCEDYSCYGAGVAVSNWTKETFPGFDRRILDENYNVNSRKWKEVADIVDDLFLITAFVYRKINLIEKTLEMKDLTDSSRTNVLEIRTNLSNKLKDLLDTSKDYYRSELTSQMKRIEIESLTPELLDMEFKFIVEKQNGKRFEIYLKQK